MRSILALSVLSIFFLPDLETCFRGDEPEASPPRVSWRKDYNLAIEEAENSKRPLLLYFVEKNSKGCAMQDEIWAAPELARIVSERFTPLNWTARTRVLAGFLGIDRFPTIVLTDVDRTIQRTLVGLTAKERLIAVIEEETPD